MEATYRVVFCGEVLPGFELPAVKLTAQQRLKASPAMLEQLFSGRRVILKKGLVQEIGTRYIAELETLGMKAALEPEIAVAPATAPLMSSGVMDTRNAPTQATTVVPTTQPPAVQPVSPASEQTLYVPRADQAEQHAVAGAEPTVFVSRTTPPPVSSGAEPTVFVGKGSTPKFNAENTLIASAETLAAYFAAPTQAPDDPSLLEDSGATAARKDPMDAPRPFRGSDDKTVLAAPAPQPAPVTPPPAPRPAQGSSEKTVFVAPRRGNSHPTETGNHGLSSEAKRSLMEAYQDEDMDAPPPAKGKGQIALIALLLLVAAGAAAYYFLYMR